MVYMATNGPDQDAAYSLSTDRVAEVFKALGHTQRLNIVRALAERALSCGAPDKCDFTDACCDVGEIASTTGIANPTLSYHLKELRNAGVISVRRAGRHAYYSFNAPYVEAACSFVSPYNSRSGGIL